VATVAVAEEMEEIKRIPEWYEKCLNLKRGPKGESNSQS
jgi:hypothetical protein